MNPEKQARDDGAVRIFAALFKRMCDEDDDFASQEARRGASPNYFLGHLQKTLDLVNGVELVAELGVPQAAWDMVQTIVNTGNVLPLLTVWPRVILADEPPPKHVLAHSHLFCLLEWEDGRIVPISMFLPRWFAPNNTLDTGTVASMLQQQIHGAVQQVVERGLDGCHEHMSESFGGTATFEAFAAMVEAAVAQRPAADQPYFHKWLVLFRGLVRPPLTPEVKATIAAAKRREAAKPPRGGWDE
jgi:hypothetical protein